MRIKVNYPGFWADGLCYQATREVLQITPGGGGQGKHKKMRWAAKPTGNPRVFEIDCFIVEDPKCAKFAVPVTHARVLNEAAA